jgi:HK97 family phage prohead protease
MEKFTKDLKAGVSDFKILNEEKGTFEAYVSIFNNIDYADEVILKGAFADSIRRKMPKIAWSHNWSEIIGKVNTAIEDDRGLKIQGQLVLSVQKAKEAYDLMKAGATDEFSIGYGIQEARYEERDGKTIRVLVKLDLYEISPVLSGCNPDTSLLGIKGNDTVKKDDEIMENDEVIVETPDQVEIKEMTDIDNSVKIVMTDNTEVVLNRNQVFDNYLTEKSGVKVADNVAKKLLIIKQVYKKKINIDNFLYKSLKDLDIK